MREETLEATGADADTSATVIPASFEEFFEMERGRLFAMLFVAVGHRQEAEEIMQDAFLVLWERWESVGRQIDNPSGYLTRTAINLLRRRYRRAEMFRRVLPSLARDAGAAPDPALELSEALETLTTRQRAALVLTEILGYSAAEAGQFLKIKPSTVGALKYQARSALNDSDSDDE